MANLNKVMLIGRLGAKPELHTFSNGGRVAKLRMAVNNRVKNQQTGQWEDKPVWFDVKAFNRETGRKLADLCEQYLDKGHQVYVEGHLIQEEWDDKETGQKRSKLLVVMDSMEFLESKAGGRSEGAPTRSAPPTRSAAPPQSAPAHGGGFDDEQEPPMSGHQDEEIPF